MSHIIEIDEYEQEELAMLFGGYKEYGITEEERALNFEEVA